MTGSTISLHRHGTTADFAAAIADRLATELATGLAGRGKSSFAVPGGTTPGPVFDDLAKRDLAWSQVTVTLTDERWVPVDDAASNEALLRQRLLTGKAQAASLIGLKSAAATPSAGIAEIEQRLAGVPSPFDVILLGMGGDGHFASLFPNMPATPEGLDLTTPRRCVVSDEAINGQPRISLTLPFLLQSRVILLSVRGADKMQVIDRAKTATPADLPIAALLHQDRTPVEIHYTD